MLPSGQYVLFTDTVGFIQKLPTLLVASFRATLEEVTEADVLVHVVDTSHANVEAQVAAVEEVLEEIGAGDKTMVTALNKIDAIDRDDANMQALLGELEADYPNPVRISALTGEGLLALESTVDEVIRLRMVHVDVTIPYARGELVAMLHEHGFLELEEHTETGTHITAWLPVRLAGRLAEFGDTLES
jgi:GTP-binding protein HflX